MKKALLIIGIILLACALLGFGAAAWFYFMAHSYSDGTMNIYVRLMNFFRAGLFTGIGLTVLGAVMLIIRGVLKKKEKG